MTCLDPEDVDGEYGGTELVSCGKCRNCRTWEDWCGYCQCDRPERCLVRDEMGRACSSPRYGEPPIERAPAEPREHEFDMQPLETCGSSCPECRRQQHENYDRNEDG